MVLSPFELDTQKGHWHGLCPYLLVKWYNCYGVIDMKLLKVRIWNWTDIAFLKWSAILFGMIVGAYLSAFVKQYAIAILLLACLLAIRPLIAYFKDSE